MNLRNFINLFVLIIFFGLFILVLVNFVGLINKGLNNSIPSDTLQGLNNQPTEEVISEDKSTQGNNDQQISDSPTEVKVIAELATNSPDINAQISAINVTPTGHSFAGYDRSLVKQIEIVDTGVWTATQYKQGDITSKTYTVQLGDTLWQIAQAYYGDGAQWIKILDANSSQIGFLPDGEQALIYPGQVLSLI